MHSVVLHFMTWPHTFHPSTPSIHPSVHSVSLYDRHTHSLVVFFFSLYLFHSPKTVFLRVYIAEVSTVKEEKKKRKRSSSMERLFFSSFSLYLFTVSFPITVSKWILCNCNFVEIRKVANRLIATRSYFISASPVWPDTVSLHLWTYDEAFQILIESSREMKTRTSLSGSMRTCKYDNVQFTILRD